ncbi:MAG: aminoacyl-tRNA hydrolase [Candidatus Paceibacterota bacterium]
MNYLIAGLGNPGKKYHGTRHNVGFTMVDELASRWQGTDFTASNQAEALVSEAMVDGRKILLAKPQTFMNNSGDAIAALASYFNIPAEHVLVIYDDVDLSLGKQRLAVGRGTGGHKGLQSVIDRLARKDFLRLRVGISPSDEEGNVLKQKVPGKGINPFVMSRFSSEELVKLEAQYDVIEDALTTWVRDGVEPAMNVIN